jgi:hypothetical protein
MHLQSELDKFPLLPIPLERQWMAATSTHPQYPLQRSLRILNTLLLHHIIDLSQLTLSGGTQFMDQHDFQVYYATPTKLVKTVLQTLEQFVCHLGCTPPCLHPCHIHHLSRILLPQYITANHIIYPLLRLPPLHPTLPPHPIHPKAPRYITQNLIQYPINRILDHKEHKTPDKNKITNKFVSYLCQWIIPNQQTYHKWLPQHRILP